MDGVICTSAYFDKILPGEQVEKELKMLMTELRGKNRYGETTGTFTMTYEDANGTSKQMTQTLTTNIIQSESLTESEKAAREAEQMKQNTLSKWWISVLAAVAVIAILCSCIITGKFARQIKMR